MAYYPKSQIKTNLYTNGGYFSTSPPPFINEGALESSYVGYYYLTSNGKAYTGKNPKDPTTVPLYLITLNSPDNSVSETDIVLSIITSDPEQNILLAQYSQYPNSQSQRKRTIPSFYVTLPTEQDKQNGYFTRYFCKKNNQLMYFEISQTSYSKLKSQNPTIAYDLYSGLSLQWAIKGDFQQVASINQSNVNRASSQNNWPGFIQFFKNFTQYYVES